MPEQSSWTPRVLVVEDSAIEAMLLERVLADLGYGVLGPVDSGEEAVEAARRIRPDIVVMDVSLRGDLGGIEAAELISAEQGSAVVFLTAHGDPEMNRRMERIAGAAILGKPFTERILALTLRQILRDRLQARPSGADAGASPVEHGSARRLGD